MVRTSDFETLRHPFSRGAHRWVPPVSARHVSTRRGSTVDIGAEDCLGVGSCGGCLGGLSRGVVLWRESRGGLSRNMSRGVVSGRESREGCLEVGVSGRGVAGQGWAALCKKRVPSERRGQGKTAKAYADAGQKREPQTKPRLLLMSGGCRLCRRLIGVWWSVGMELGLRLLLSCVGEREAKTKASAEMD
jgi:hypothetical protein